MVSNEKRQLLVDAFTDELIKRSDNMLGSCIYFAGFLADRAIEEGWQWHPKPEPLAEWEKELLWNAQEEEKVTAEGPEPTWVRIPEFVNYEVNTLGVVRNFWTKRVLGEYAVAPDQIVELHEKDGSPFRCSIQMIMDKTFGVKE